ncbi:hypothetical protein CK203_070132 [Vitis vinifera]|uniref:BHLH domain-containing protein n=1 Tax=Vitis vinifera TaxID=29760 RepID=A0A438EHL0_VITVI|nr:hypothetical protein CK203_070132 [Vitis vinifera]
MEVSRCKEMSGEKLRRRRRRSVRRKVKKLQRLIPGGRGLQPDRLFLRTADYILHLRLQVNVLQALSKIYKLESSGFLFAYIPSVLSYYQK